MKFHISSIRPPQFLHSSGFAELIDSLSWSLAELGHQVVIRENTFSPDGMNILFGAELLSKEQELPDNTIIYNLEQPEHPSFPNIKRLAKGKQVWDYNKQNYLEWKRLGYEAQHVPFGYTPNLTKISKAAIQDIDVFFSGWLTPRRKKILNELRDAGLKVEAVDSIYGGSRDNLISRSKVCLNINHDGRTLTNIQRLSFWMANSKCIVSETSSDMHDYDDLLSYMKMARYDQLVETCVDLIKKENYRTSLEYEAFDAFSRRDYVSTVAGALEFTSTPNPILQRYENGCKEGDMKEYLPWLRKNAYGRILEIGVRDGASTAAILLGLEEHGGHLHSIDTADCSELWKHPRWTFECGDSKLAKFPDNEFDMALIDGDHTKEGFLADLHNCYRWVRSGGFIACHDIEPSQSFESCGGDFPSLTVGQEYRKFAGEKQVVNFELPGEQGMGVLVVKK
jgi:hypothetical protein